MASTRRNEVFVGSFTLLSLFLVAVLVFLMGGLDGCRQETAKVTAVFRDVQGLQPGDPVYLFGVKCGKVASLELGPDAEREARVAVTVTIPARHLELLRTTTRVHVDRTLTGNLSILFQRNPIDPGKPLAPGVELTGTPAADFGAITQDAANVLQEAEKALGSVSRIVDGLEKEGRISNALAAVTGFTEDLRAAVEPLRGRLETGLARFETTLTSVEALVEENRPGIRETVTHLNTSLDRFSSLLASLESTPGELDESLRAIRVAASGVGTLIEDNRVHLDSILADLDETSANAANLTAEVKRRPWRLLYRPTPEELQSLELYDAAWAYNLAATELHKSARNLASHLERPGQGDRYETALELALRQVEESLRRERDAGEAFWERLATSEE